MNPGDNMKRLRFHAAIIMLVYAAAAMTVVISHNHWDTRMIESNGGQVYCHFVKNPPLRNINPLPVALLIFLVVSLGMVAERGIAYFPGVYSLPPCLDPFIAHPSRRAPPVA